MFHGIVKDSTALYVVTKASRSRGRSLPTEPVRPFNGLINDFRVLAQMAKDVVKKEKVTK
jgi:hypothetical protein